MKSFYFANCSDVARVAAFSLTPHSHALGQLTFIRWGLMQVETDDAHLVVPEGRLCWMPPGMPHAARCAGEASYWQLLMSPAYAGMLPAEVCALRVSALALAAFDRAVRGAAGGSGLRDEGGEGSMLHSVVRHELGMAVREPFGIPLPRAEPWRGMAHRLRDEPADRRALDDFAAIAGLSRRTFSRQFRRETGTSFAAWRRAAAGQRSLELLCSGKSVSDTAEALGYESVSAFTYAFRKRFGTSPLRFLGDGRSDGRSATRSPPPSTTA